MPNGEPTFWLIAGPNGVGKTTYAMRHLKAVSGSINFVNLDEIARGLSPIEPSQAQTDAARIALSRAHDFIKGRQTFAMETTLSGLAHLRLLETARQAGLQRAMLYFSVTSPDICLERIARRVAEGGHDVAETIVRRRFERSARNLARYAAECDLWRIYEASGARPRLALEGKQDAALSYRDAEVLAAAHESLRRLAMSFEGGIS
jgi:predicted ABC-type ATPase